MTLALPYLIFLSGMLCFGVALYAACLAHDTGKKVEKLKRLLNAGLLDGPDEPTEG